MKQVRSFAALVLMVTVACGAQTALARGTSDRGGGVAIVCRERGQERVYLADTFALARAGELNFEIRDPNEVLAMTFEYLETVRPAKIYPHPFKKNEKVSLGWLILHAHAHLNSTYVETLPLLGDDGINSKDLPRGCRKEQVVVQNISAQSLTVVLNRLSQMTMLERGLLDLHEALISLRNAPGENTASIRNAVESLYSENGFMYRELLRQFAYRVPVRRPIAADTQRWNECRLETDPSSECGRLMGKMLDDQRDLARRAALPTLHHIPKSMTCFYKNRRRDDLGWFPGNFIMTRVSGNGRAGSESEYSLVFSNIDSSGYERSQSAHLQVEPFRESTIPGGRFGNSKISVTWAQHQPVSVILDHYLEQTGEFVGSIQRVSSPGQGTAFSSYGISCWSDDVRFDLAVK